MAASDGDRARCGHPNPVWYTDNRLWNEVMGGDPYAEAGGVICLDCFMIRADDHFADKPMEIVGWRLVPDFGFAHIDGADDARKQRCYVHTFVTIDKCGCPPDPTLIDGGEGA